MESKFPLLFRILAILNIIGGMILTLMTIILAVSHSRYTDILIPCYGLTALWYITSGFCWFLAGKRSVSYLFITAITSISLAVILFYYYFFKWYHGNDSRVIFGTGAIFLTAYGLFNIIAAFNTTIKEWKSKNNPAPLLKPGLVTGLFLISIGIGIIFHFTFLPDDTNYYSDNNEEEIIAAASMDPGVDSSEVFTEPEIEIYERSFEATTMIALYESCVENNEQKHPFDYPYLKTGKQIELDGTKFGQFVGGPNALRYEIFPAIAKNANLSYKDYWDMFYLRVEVELFKSLKAPQIFDRQDELLNWKDNWPEGFSYRENFIRWAYSNFIPQSDDIILGERAYDIYHVVYSRFFRLMVESYHLLHGAYDLDRETTWYNEAVSSDSYLIDMLDERYKGELEDYKLGDEFYGCWEPSHAIAFWLRRTIDGNDAAVMDGLRIIMERFDQEWYNEQLPSGC